MSLRDLLNFGNGGGGALSTQNTLSQSLNKSQGQVPGYLSGGLSYGQNQMNNGQMPTDFNGAFGTNQNYAGPGGFNYATPQAATNAATAGTSTPTTTAGTTSTSPSHSSIADAMFNINQAHADYSGGNQGSPTAFGEAQDLTQKQWAAQHGMLPDQIAMATSGVAFTPEEYDNMQNAEAASYGNQLTNLTRGLAWNNLSPGTTSGGGSSDQGNVDQNGVFMGVNFGTGGNGSYAEDPTKVAQLNGWVNKIQGVMGSPESIDAYLQQNYPGSKLTGAMVMDAAQKTGQNPTLLLANALQESTNPNGGGISDVAKKYGNYTGFTDGKGNYKDYTGNEEQSLIDAGNWMGKHAYDPVQAAAQDAAKFNQYGLLGTVPGFNGSNPQSDDGYAATYIQNYMSNGKIPTATTIGLPTAAKARLQNIATRANELYSKVTGNPMPSEIRLNANQKLLSDNNEIANNLNINEDTVKKNFQLSVDNLTKNDLNNSNSVVNGIVNIYRQALSDPATVAYISQNATLQKEMGNLLNVKNGTGGTVHDMLTSAQIIPKNASVAAQKEVLNKMIQEAGNLREAIQGANLNLYRQVDPLMKDPANPLRAQFQSGQQSLTTNGSVNLSDPKTGEVRSFKGLSQTDLLTAINKGYMVSS